MGERGEGGREEGEREEGEREEGGGKRGRGERGRGERKEERGEGERGREREEGERGRERGEGERGREREEGRWWQHEIRMVFELSSLSPSNAQYTNPHAHAPPPLTDLSSKLCYPLLRGVGREGGISGKLLWKSWVLEPQQCLEGTK